MATPKKKHLIELMIEAGVKWPDGAEYAAQDKTNLKVHFYINGKPILSEINIGKWTDHRPESVWLGGEFGVVLPSLCRNWHQTIVTREQYAEALAAVTTDVKREANPEPKYCDSVMRQMPDNTIEQLTSDYHAKAAEADRLQAVADEALKAADDALIALEKAGELIGLVISIDTNPKQVAQPAQQEITDWRDLRVGDIVECVRGESLAYEGERGEVCEIDEDDSINRIRVKFNKNQSHWCRDWRFISRP